MLVLVVSSYLLFQNVYTTFKALRPAKPSRRSKNGVDPTVKAKQARKRELKGMLACWIVWSCWTSAEAIADRTISVLTPFYNEIKMFLVLFLIVGRATMAEAILLHVIRPIVKPYYVSLDSCVEVFTSAADFAVLLFTAPLVWLKLVTHQAWAFLQKTFSGSLPRPGGHTASASDPDEALNEPEATSTKAEEKPDPRQRFIPKTRAYAQQESDAEDVFYGNRRDDPPPYGLPMGISDPLERDYPPVFTRHGTSRSRPEAAQGGRSYGIDHHPYGGDSSSVTSVSYRQESEVGGPTYGFSPDAQVVTNGAGDLVPDTNPDIPSFVLPSPEQPPTSVPAAPAVPSYLQPRTRASRANLNPSRQRVDSYVDRPNPRASKFMEGERGMTFADKPKEAKGFTPEVGGYTSPPANSPPTGPTPPYSNPYGTRGRTGYPPRAYTPAEESDGGSRSDAIQGWRQRSAIPPDSKHKRAPSAGPGGSSYPYQAASTPYSPQAPSAVLSFPSPQIPPAFPAPSIAPSLTPSQSVSNVFPRPQPGYRPPSVGPEGRPPTAVSRPPTTTPSHPPTSTTGMGLPRRQRSTRELRAQVWDPKEDNSAAEADRLREEERLAIEKKEAERVAALERQRRKVSVDEDTWGAGEGWNGYRGGGILRGRVAAVRLRDRQRGRALRGVEREKNGSNVGVEEAGKGEEEVEERRKEGAAVDDDGEYTESPSKRRRVDAGGKFVSAGSQEGTPRRRPARTRLPVASGSSGAAPKVVPAKRPAKPAPAPRSRLAGSSAKTRSSLRSSTKAATTTRSTNHAPKAPMTTQTTRYAETVFKTTNP
ncbi:hypothetical protein FRC07_005151 [Ceratobasidium sp. 392]|nr:hypothetical protein FRC07_005151 [Ceratobasidium sp. 392]